MRKFFLFSFVILLVPFGLDAREKSPLINLEKSYVLGLWSFVDSLAELKRPSKILRDKYLASSYNTLKAKADVDQIRDIVSKNFGQRYLFSGFPEQRDEMSWDLHQHVYYQASQSKTIEDFESRLGQTMPAADLKQLIAHLKTFDPIYKKMIWNPEEKSLDKNRFNLVKRLNSIPFAQMYDKVQRFYRAQPAEKSHITFALHPIPGKGGNTTATVIYDTALVQVLSDEPDLDGRLGVFFHEICHSFYEAQPLAVQKKIDQFFQNDTSFWSTMTYKLINEALATAIGNGWFYEKISGKIDTTSWYNDAEIDALAKAIYPMVVEYLEKNKHIDLPFIQFSIAKIKELYPQGPVSFKFRLNNLMVVGAGLGAVKLSALKSELRQNVEGLRDLSMSSPIDHPRTFENLEQMRSETSFMIIFGGQETDSYKVFAKKFPQLVENFRLPSLSKRWVWYDGNQSKRLRIFAQVQTDEDFTQLVKFLLAEETMKRSQQLIEF